MLHIPDAVHYTSCLLTFTCLLPLWQPLHLLYEGDDIGELNQRGERIMEGGREGESDKEEEGWESREGLEGKKERGIKVEL